MMKLRNSVLTRAMMSLQVRNFGPKGKAGGGPPSAPYEAPPLLRTPMEVLVERQGVEAFMFGPPSGITKPHQAHRDVIYPKVGQRMEFLAKKMREQYIREAIYPEDKIFFDPIRERQLEDTLPALHDQMEVATVINGRDEFDDVDLVLPHRTPYTIQRVDHGMVRPYWIRWKDEEIMVTPIEIKRHMKTERPVHMEFQRYIAGRPNLLTLPIWPVQEDKSLHFEAGADFRFLVREIKVWCYNASWPAVLEINCKNMSPQMAFKIGDLEKILPHGMFLHGDHQKQKFHSIVKMNETNAYIQRKNAVIEQQDLIRDAKKNLQAKLMSANQIVRKKKQKSEVPLYIRSSKHIINEKKIAQAGLDEYGRPKGEAKDKK